MTRDLVILSTLLALLALTTGLAFVDLGKGNLVAALAIAGAKALLVALTFMRLLAAEWRLRLPALVAVYWLTLLIGLTVWVNL